MALDKKFLEKMEKALVEQKRQIIADLIANNEDLKESVKNEEPGDFADIASDDIDRKMLEAKGAVELNRLKSIEATLTRIQQGKYGYCVKCGQAIPYDRLEAIPYALMCITCKTAEERRTS